MAFETLAQRFESNANTIYNRIISDTVFSEGTSTTYTGRPVNSTQPFLIILPNTSPGPLSANSRVKDDSRALPVVSSARDVQRLTQFVKSDAGKLFITKQGVLQAFNPYPKTRLFNPTGLLASALPLVQAPRHITSAFLNGITNSVGDSPLESGISGNNGYLEPRLGDATKRFTSAALGFATQKLKEEFGGLFPLARKTPNISDPFNNTPAQETKGNGNVVIYKFLEKQENVLSAVSAVTEVLGINKKTDIITFKFSPVGTLEEESTSVPFRAFISSIKESVKPEFAEQKYIGRTERFITYSGAKRSVQLQFNIVALTASELDHMWARINYLTGLAFPKGVSQSGFMTPPLFRITIGQIYQNQPCYVEALDYDFLDDNITFDIQREVSQVINVNMTLSLIEKQSRYYNSPFYEITKRIAENKQNLRKIGN
jgi:hypothetical protein